MTFFISQQGEIRTGSDSSTAGQILCEASGMEEHCIGDCCSEEPVTDDPAGDLMVLHHIDGNPSNNDPANLMPMRARENARHRIRITKQGEAYPEWWSEQASEILCTACGGNREECLRKSRGGMFFACGNIVPFCG